MTDITIHNINISYDESHGRVREFIEYLKSEKRKEDLKTYFKEARRSSDRKYHPDHRDENGDNNEFTLEYLGEHNCTLRLRGM